MKKLLAVSAIALGLTSVAFAGGIPEEMSAAPMASDAGFYIGVEGGWGMTHWDNIFGDEIVNDENGFVARGFLGYDINRYFAIEAGYTHFFSETHVGVAGTTLTDIRTQAIDLLGKIKAPIVENFDLFAKLGGAYLMSHAHHGIAVEDDLHNFCLAFGAGADYYITPNVIANIEWLRYDGHSKFHDDYQPQTDAFMVGVRYKFDL